MKTMHKCPKCKERSLVKVKHNVYECIACRFRVDLNVLEEKSLISTIGIGSLSGLMVCVLTWISFGKISPDNMVLSQSHQQISSDLQSAKSMPTQKPIAKAISGNRVVLEIGGKSREVLLCGINVPTPASQLFGAATNFLQQLLDRAGANDLIFSPIAEVDGMPIVELYDRRNATSLNAQLVASGYAVSSQVLAKECRDRDRS